MTVQELIERLKDCPPEQDVYIQGVWLIDNLYSKAEICGVANVKNCVFKESKKEYTVIIIGACLYSEEE